MKNKFTKKLVAMILAMTMIFALSANAFANDEVMPIDMLPSSLNIETQNIDLRNIPDNRIISEADKEYLQRYLTLYKVSLENIDTMTIQGFDDFFETQPVQRFLGETDDIKSRYPELADIDISNWTYGDWQHYFRNKPMPINSHLDPLVQRGITEADALYLIKELYGLENVITKSDKELKALLEEYYEMKNLFARYILNPEVAIFAPPSYLQGTTYRSVEFPEYSPSPEWVHEDAQSHIAGAGALQYEAMRAAYRAIFGRDSIKAQVTNIHGAWSTSREGAHEGFDFLGGAGSSVKAIVGGSVGKPNPSLGCVYVANSAASFYYAHMSNLTTSSSVAANQEVGKQSDVGVPGSNHLHLEAHNSNNSVQMQFGRDNYLTSASPYVAMHNINGNHTYSPPLEVQAGIFYRHCMLPGCPAGYYIGR